MQHKIINFKLLYLFWLLNFSKYVSFLRGRTGAAGTARSLHGLKTRLEKRWSSEKSGLEKVEKNVLNTVLAKCFYLCFVHFIPKYCFIPKTSARSVDRERKLCLSWEKPPLPF